MSQTGVSMYRPTAKREWWFCGILTLQAFITIALEAYILVEWQRWVTSNITQVPVSYIVPIGMGILVFACVYEAILALDAIHNKNNILLFAICISNVCSNIFAAMQCTSMQHTATRLFAESAESVPALVNSSWNVWPRIKPAEILVPVVTSLGTGILWPCAYYLHREYSWAIYKCVHGSSEIRMRYLAYEIYLVLIKLDFYFLVGFIIQYDLVVVHFNEPEYTLTMLLIPAAFVVMVLGIYFVQHEITFCMFPIVACYIGLIAYLLSQIILLCGNGVRANTAGKDMMLLFAFIALVFTVGTLVCAIICMTNFNRGLKMVNKRKDVTRESYMFKDVEINTSYQGRTSRISLD